MAAINMITVLIVDDEPDMLRIAKTFIERGPGLTVDIASSTKAADEMRSKRIYDCLVVDYQMPNEDGLAYLKRLRSAGDMVTYILFTGHSHEDVVIDALNTGADFYLRKAGDPKVKFAELSNMIRQAVGRHRSSAEAARLAVMVAESSDAIISTDLEGNFKTWNKGAERIYGAKAEDVIGSSASKFFPADRLTEMALILDKMRKGHTAEELRTERVRADGTRIFTSATYFPLKDPSGRVVEAVGFVRDITPERVIQKKLESSEREFRELVQSSPCIICRLSPAGETLFVNDFVKTAIGYDSRELIGRNWWDVLYPGPLGEQVDAVRDVMAKQDVSSYEMILQDKRGRHRTMLWTSFNRYDEANGRLLEVNGVGLDVTDARTAAEGLRESGLFNRAVLDSLDAHIAVIDRDGRIVAVNDSWERFARNQGERAGARTGHGANYIEVTKKSADAGAEGAKEALSGIRDVLKGALSTFTMEYACSTPEAMMWFVMRVTPLSKRRGGVVISHHDVTEMKVMEQALRASEQRYRTIFENTGTAIAILSETGTVMLVNTELERISGYSKMELEGRMSWHAVVAPKDLQRVMEYNKKRRADPANAPRSYEFDAVVKGGGVKHVFASADLIPGTTSTLVSLIDVTDRKRTEEAVRLANRKLSMLGSMTRHDILNQLTVIYGSLDRLGIPTPNDRHAESVKRAREAGENIQRLLEFARDYQNAGTHEPVWLNLSETASKAADHFDGMGQEYSFDLGTYEVLADPMMEKVFYNLIDNSLRHGERAKGIAFSAKERKDGLHIICEDDGVGIPGPDKERVFELGVGKNTGYGLYLAREILAITGLTIRESGVHGKGARFEIRVPPEAYRRLS